ncbi:MAG: PadR family transcriptional regulator [Anaerolineae bacterium]|nr:PadR family transcriptional regulator [Anaerolineae bacterium]
MTARDSQSLLPLTPAVFHILLALADGERHGYGIMQEIAQFTDGRLRLGPGTLYRSINQMLADGLIEECEGPAEAETRERRYYRLTAFGQRVAQAEMRRLADLVAFGQSRRWSVEADGA